MADVLKQIEELTEKAARYEHMKERYLAVANKLRQGLDLIEESIKELDPASAVKTRTRDSGRTAELTEKTAEQYKKMEVGFLITMDSLRKDYPELEENSIKNIFYIKLSNAPKVMKRREGRVTTLYIQKNT